MATVYAPNRDLQGTHVGVEFVDGVAHTDNRTSLTYFRRRGYRVVGDESAAPAAEVVELDDLSVPELRAYAVEHSIDLGSAKKKADIIAAIKGAS